MTVGGGKGCSSEFLSGDRSCEGQLGQVLDETLFVWLGICKNQQEPAGQG